MCVHTAITKLTIVDKFGQAISVPPPEKASGQTQWRTPRLQDPDKAPMPEFIHPCLSEQLIPSVLDGGTTLNTVYTTKDTQDKATSSGYPMTPFIQLTPAINQDARINASLPQAGHGGGCRGGRSSVDTLQRLGEPDIRLYVPTPVHLASMHAPFPPWR